MVSCGYIRNFSVSLVRFSVNSGFGKTAGCALQGRTLLKRCNTINVLKGVLSRQLVFETFFEKNLWKSLMCRLYTVGSFTEIDYWNIYQIFRLYLGCKPKLYNRDVYLKIYNIGIPAQAIFQKLSKKSFVFNLCLVTGSF